MTFLKLSHSEKSFTLNKNINENETRNDTKYLNSILDNTTNNLARKPINMNHKCVTVMLTFALR